jgi:hypothetical protein
MEMGDQVLRAGCCELWTNTDRPDENGQTTSDFVGYYYFYVVLTNEGTTLQLDVMTTPSGTVIEREWDDPRKTGFNFYGFDGREKVEYVYPFKEQA